MNLELWGGIECTVNRVGDRYFDQMERNGHVRRLDDLNRLADLGLRTLRYPIHWEKVQPHSAKEFDWHSVAHRLERMRSLGIRPIAGLIHHGCGPRWTNLLDPDIPKKFADYALALAIRFPWIDAFTPVNEPLTTARFSGLYGHWYPHAKDDASFQNILLNEIEGTILAMQAIRSVRPDAQLIQTEDLGKVFSTPLLEYQARFENERRWLSFDLLSGRFREGCELWNFFTSVKGTRLDQLERIGANPCPPEVYGINYYVTSERFLDDDLNRHPAETHGGNYFHTYADVAAVRVRPEGLVGSEVLLRETFERYRRPIALTEVHLGCTREEQLRWLMEAWEVGQRLIADRVPMRAITAWALLGAFDWNTLVTRETGTYEPGAFDVRTTPPRPTALAQAVRSLITTRDFQHPVLRLPGWWERPDRIPGQPWTLPFRSHGARPIMILGGKGEIGQAVDRICQMRGLPCQALSRQEADVQDSSAVREAIDRYRPWCVINAAEYSAVDSAEHDFRSCFGINTQGAISAAQVCAEAGLPFVAFSSDLVFDGAQSQAYDEENSTHALSVYGRSKEKGEKGIFRVHPDALVVRLPPHFSPWNLTAPIAAMLQNGGRLQVPNSRISPSYLPDVLNVLLDLVVDGESGLWHLANEGTVSWMEFTGVLCREVGIADPQITVVSRERMLARRPAQSALRSLRGGGMPSLDHAFARFRQELLPLSSLTARFSMAAVLSAA